MVFPNPAKNILKVFYSSLNNNTIAFKLMDIAGQEIISKPITGMSTVELDVSHLADGLYIWEGLNGKLSIQSGKVSIQK